MCPILCNNLASAYIKVKNYQKTLEYLNIGIQSCIENQNSNCLSSLYYVKVCAEYKLKIKEYIDSFNTSIYLRTAFKARWTWKYIVIDKCKNHFGIDLL